MKGEDLLHTNMGEQQLQLAIQREPCEKHQKKGISVLKVTYKIINYSNNFQPVNHVILHYYLTTLNKVTS